MTNDSTLALVNRYRSPIMGFAALWILFFHFWQPLFANGAPAALFYAENVAKRLGFEGVDMFFLLSGTVSISQLQRRFQIGYGRAGGLVDKMERMGFITANEGSKARKVLLTREEFEDKFGPMSDGL